MWPGTDAAMYKEHRPKASSTSKLNGLSTSRIHEMFWNVLESRLCCLKLLETAVVIPSSYGPDNTPGTFIRCTVSSKKELLSSRASLQKSQSSPSVQIMFNRKMMQKESFVIHGVLTQYGLTRHQ